MTELEHVANVTHLPTRPEIHTSGGLPALSQGVNALRQFAETAQAAGQLISSIVDTPFFPVALWPRQTSSDPEKELQRRAQAIANGTGAVLSGVEIGLSPMQALHNVIVIHGRPSLYADTMVALVQAAGHRIWCEESTDTKAVVLGQRLNDPPGTPPRRGEMTIDRAKRAGWVAKNTNYISQPAAMLYARAASIACRRTAPEVLKGIPAFEEVQDDQTPQRAGAPAVKAPPVTVGEITGSPEPEVQATPAAELPLGDRVDRLVDWYAGKHGVSAEALVARVGRPQADWSEGDVTQLRDIGAQLSRGQIAVSDEFDMPSGDEPDGPVDGEVVDEPPAEEAPPDAPLEEPAPPQVPARLMRQLFAVLNKFGVQDNTRHRLASRMLNRPIGSFTELSEEDVHTLIDALGIYAEAGDDGAAQIAALTQPDREAGQ